MPDISQYNDLFASAETKYGIPSGLLPVMAQAESNGNPRAVSDAGAAGLMQFTKPTADEVGIKDRFDPAQSIDGAGKYMSQLLKRYNGDKRKALAAYNYGLSNVPVDGPWDESKLPKETRDYLTRTADRHDAIASNQPPAEAAQATRKVNLIKQGVKFTANVPVDWSDEQIQQHFKENPVPASYLSQKAADQGKYTDWETGEIKDYSNVQKFLIGAGKVTSDTINGTNQWIQQARGNADGVKEIAKQTAEENALYSHLDEQPGIGAEDVGHVLANAAVLFGPGGIIGAAARAGVFASAQATEDESGDATGRALQGAGTAAAVGTLGGAGMLLGKAARAIGPKNLASLAAPLIMEMATGHGVLTAAAVVGIRRALGGGGAPGRLGAQFMKLIGKEADNPMTKKLGELALDGGQPEATRIAAAQLVHERTAEKLAKLAAKQADEARAATAAAQKLVDAKVAAEAPQALTTEQIARMGGQRAPTAAMRAARATDVYEETLPTAQKAWKAGAKSDPTGGRVRAAIEEDPALNTLRAMRPAGTPYRGPSAAHDVPLPTLKASDIMPTSPGQFY